MSKQLRHKVKEFDRTKAAQAAPPQISPPSAPGDGETTQSTNQTSPVKFFLLWFGLPMAFIAGIAWAMAHS